jgi:hypothetical protein
MEPTEQPITMNRTLATSLVAIGLVAIALIVMLLPVLRAVMLPGVDDVAPEERVAQLLTEHEKEVMRYRARFDGRSIFFTPPQPTPPPPPRTPREPRPTIPQVVIEDETPDEPDAPQRPDRYPGPNIRAVIGDEVWFFGDIRVKAGEEKNGIEVLSVNGPWGATVVYQGFEWEVGFFEHFTLEEAEDGVATLSGRASTPPGMIEVEEDDPNAEGDRSPRRNSIIQRRNRGNERPENPADPKREAPPPS